MNFSDSTPFGAPSPKLGRLLVVDDEVPLMTALCEMLTKQGYEAVGLASGREALEALREREFDLLLTDLMMPGMDGIELLRAAREIDPHLVGLIMTGQGTVQTAVEAMKTGAFDYLLKPFKLSAVLPVVSRALDVRRLRMENVQLRGSVAIYELSQVIAFTLDLNTILNKTADAALQQCEADEASILLPTPEGNELYVAAVRGEGREYILGQRLSLEAGIAGWVARHRESITLQGEVQDARFTPLHPRPDIYSAISLPMLAGNQLVGVLNVNATQRRRRFTLGQVKALTILISAAASGLENARLYEAVQQELVRRRQAEDELRAAEAKYRTLVEQIPAITYIAEPDPHGHTLFISPQVEALLGFTADEWLADTEQWLKQLHPDDREHTLAEMRHTQVTGEPFRSDYRLLTRDGRTLWFNDEAMLVRDEAGRPQFIQGIMLDITERKRAEAALRASESELLALFAAMTDVILVLDTDGRYLKIAPTNPELYYKPPAELIGQTLHEVFPAAQADFFMEHIRRALATRGPVHMEYSLPIQGETIWFDAAISPMATGTVFLVARDITERKRVEEALRQSEATQRLVLSNIDEIAYSAQLTEDDPFAGITRFVSGRVESILGYSPHEFMENPRLWSGLLHPDDVPTVKAQTIEIFASQRSGTRGYQVRHKHTGEYRWMEDRIVPELDEAGRVVGIFGVARDVTERKRAEEALRNSEARYRVIFEQSPNGVLLVDLETGRTIEANDIAYKQLGYTREEFAALRISDYEALEKPEETAKHMQQVIREGSGDFETLHRTKSGEIRNVHVWAKTLTLGDRVVFYAIFQDITERKQAEEKLRESEDKFSKAFHSNPAMLVVATLDGKNVDVNQAYADFLGYSREEILGKSVVDLQIVSVEERQKILDLIQQGHGSLRNAEVAMRVRDDSLRHILLSADPISWGGVLHRLTTLVDITERKRAEAALIESSAQFRTLFEASPDAIMIVDPNDNWPILDCNTAACQMNGYTRDELIGQSVDVLNLTPASPAERAEYLERIRQTRVLSVETFHRRKDGTVVPIEVSTSLIALSGRDVVLGIDRDITERKRAEEEIKHRLAELEAVNQISTALRVAQTLDEMLPTLLDTTLGALHATRGSVGLYDPVKNELRAAVTRGYGEQAGDLPLKPGEGLAGAVFASGQPYVSSDFHLDPRLSEVTRQRIPPGVGGAALPIRAGENVIGVFIINVTLPRELTPGEVHLLTTLSEIAGNAIHRTRLHEQTQQRAEQLAALHTIDAAISSSLDLRVTLNILLDQVMTQLGVDAAAVLLFKPHLQTLEYAAGRGFRGKGVEHTRLRLGQGYAGRAALERHTIGLPNLAEEEPDFSRVSSLDGEAFQAYYGVPLIAKGQVEGVLEIFHRTRLTPDPEWLEFLEALAGQAAIAIDSAQLFDDLQRSNLQLTLAYDATIEGWSRALDLRDKETEGHTRRVTEMTLHLAQGMGAFTEEELVHVRRGALLHDIGKMGVPDAILLKPGPLTEDEWVVMRKHPTYAYQMLSPIVYLRPALDIPYCHHEKWDGTGYPRGLKGEQIPLAARIFAVVDVWDALRSDRPYRAGWLEAKVREHLRSLAGTHFDPQAVEVFLRVTGEAL